MVVPNSDRVDADGGQRRERPATRIPRRQQPSVSRTITRTCRPSWVAMAATPLDRWLPCLEPPNPHCRPTRRWSRRPRPTGWTLGSTWAMAAERFGGPDGSPGSARPNTAWSSAWRSLAGASPSSAKPRTPRDPLVPFGWESTTMSGAWATLNRLGSTSVEHIEPTPSSARMIDVCRWNGRSIALRRRHCQRPQAMLHGQDIAPRQRDRRGIATRNRARLE